MAAALLAAGLAADRDGPGARGRRAGQALARAARAAPGTVVDLDTLAPFAWDSVWVFGPYTGMGGYRGRVASPAERAAARTGIGDRDDANVLVFLHRGAPAAVVALPKPDGDFLLPAGRFALARGEARPARVPVRAGGAAPVASVLLPRRLGRGTTRRAARPNVALQLTGTRVKFSAALGCIVGAARRALAARC
jgi:hypothetical protein